MVLQAQSMEIYIDGKLERSISLFNPPIVSTDNLHITNTIGKTAGFPGLLAYIQYFPQALTPNKIEAAYNKYKGVIDRFTETIYSTQIAGIGKGLSY